MARKNDQSVDELNKQYKDLRPTFEFKGVIPTGSILLDYMLGCNGWMFGHMHEVYGPEASGKTTLVMHAVAEAQKMGILPLFVDQERTFNKEYAQEMGINTNEDKFLIFNPNSLEEGLDLILNYSRTGQVKLVVVDSVAAMIPQATMDDPNSKQIALKGRKLSDWLPIFGKELQKHNICALFVNQTRVNINTGWTPPGAEVDTVTSGKAIRFYYSTRVRIETSSIPASETLVWNEMLHKEEKVRLYQRSKLTIKKNKIKSPEKREMITIRFGEGVDNIEFLNDLLTRMKIVEIKGAGFGEYKGPSGFKFRGKNEFKERLKSDQKLYQECLQYVEWYQQDKYKIGQIIEDVSREQDDGDDEIQNNNETDKPKKRGRKKIVSKIEV